MGDAISDNPYQQPTQQEVIRTMSPASAFGKRGAYGTAVILQLTGAALATAAVYCDPFRIGICINFFGVAGIVTAVLAIRLRDPVGVVFGLSGVIVWLVCEWEIGIATQGKPLLTRAAHNAQDLLRPTVLFYLGACLCCVLFSMVSHLINNKIR